MKTLYTILLSIFLFANVKSNAQPLAAGDIMIIGWNSVDNTTNSPTFVDDDICFLLMRSITNGTQIYFTDFGWTGSGFQQNTNNGCTSPQGALNDGCIRWTASSDLPAGTKVRIGVHFGLVANTGTVTGIVSSPSGGVGGPGGVSTPYMSLTTANDQIFAFTGSLASPTLIAAVHYGGVWGSAGAVTTCQFSSTLSVNPNASVGGYGFNFTSTLNNAQYTGVTSGGAAAIRTAILNAANWTANDVTTYAFPQSLTFTLPVNLISFTGKTIDTGHLIEWTVADEESFSHYDLERSNDGTNYNSIASLPGAHKQEYSFTATPSQSVSQYYRLKMVDADGKFNYSNVIRLENGPAQKITVYPNPVRSIVNITAASSISKFWVTDMAGKKVMEVKGNGSNTEKVNIAHLKEGPYLLVVSTVKGTESQKIYRKD